MYEFTHRLPHEPWRKPSRNEEEYFHRVEFEERRLAALKREQQREVEERKRLKALHQDHCPGCGAELEHLRVRNVRAAQCPVCNGVWLDRQVFESLTRAEKRNPLTDLLRDVLLSTSMGEVDPPERRDDG